MNIRAQVEEIAGGTAKMKKTVQALLQTMGSGVGQSLVPLRALGGRLRYLSPLPRRFTGAYRSFDEAITAAAKAGPLAGYNHDEIAHVAFEQMCRVAPWDYPVLFWLSRLGDRVDGLLDAGGHMGTKYRAFRSMLDLPKSFQWVVYELPAIAEAGRRRAERDGLDQLHFVDRLENAPGMSVFLGSGLMQYLDVPLSSVLTSLPHLPQHLLLNKVAFRKGGPIVTLERIGKAYVPYQMRDEGDFVRDLEQLGYRQIDRWSIGALSHVIETHPELGASDNAGFYFRLEPK
ncbi:methyltransferase, TIGR04325 family [Rhizobium sp. 18065]|uniref:methyltransferase, TIGR04325 family n=1 Tax=Rhizobium sp. 18065 TaxID=2681411 RepID=UPI001FCEC55D|nr:methyltransferase, TIGR04325 family [Rhizobium sp. 18065]